MSKSTRRLSLALALGLLSSACGGGDEPSPRGCAAYGLDGTWSVEVESVVVQGGTEVPLGLDQVLLQLTQWTDNVGDALEKDGVDECSVVYYIDSPAIYADPTMTNMDQLFFAIAGLDNYSGRDDMFMLFGYYYSEAHDKTVGIIGAHSDSTRNPLPTIMHGPNDWTVPHAFWVSNGFTLLEKDRATNNEDDDDDGSIDESDETGLYLDPDDNAIVISEGFVNLRLRR